MKKQLFAVAILSALVLGAPVMAEDSVKSKSESSYDPKSNGGFESKESVEQTDAKGTTVTHKTNEEVDVDNKGNKETKVNIKNTTDPKGLFNKTSTEIENKATEKDGKAEYSHKKTVNGHVVEENEQTQQPQR